MKVLTPITPIRFKGQSVFLAGPTPRDAETKSWRPEFIERFDELIPKDLDLTLISPESETWLHDYDSQVEWEWTGIMMASIVLFWIPREILTMPAFTTNVEFGLVLGQYEIDLWHNPNKTFRNIVYGHPFDAPKTKYLDWHAERLSIPVFHTQDDMIQRTISLLKEWR